jgi:hypothetical protein
MMIENNELKKKVNSNLIEFIVHPDYEILRIKAVDLLTPNRFDVVAKYLYIKFVESKINSSFAKELYLKHINAFNGFVENDESQKIGKEAFLKSFHDVIDSIKNNGFDENYIIPLSQNQTIIDGAHRIACSIFFDQEVQTVSLEVEQQNFNYEFFEQRGVDRIYLDSMALEYARLKDNVFMIIVWPIAQGYESELQTILNKYGEIVYRRNIFLNSNGMIHLVRQAYRTESWLGSYNNDFEGARNKVRWCYKEPGEVRVFLFESDQDLITMKDEIRNVFKIEKHAVHINDKKEEMLELAELILNQNSIDWMNGASLKEYRGFNTLFSQYSNWFTSSGVSKEDFTLIGGVLAVYGVRESSDIDYINKNNLEYDFGNKQIELETKKNQFASVGTDEMIYNPNCYFYAYGQKFVILNILRAIKEKRKKGHDEEDVIMLNELIENGKYNESLFDTLKKIIRLSFWKRNVKFILLKIRFVIFSILKKIK